MARRTRARSRSRRPEVVPGKVGDPMVRRRAIGARIRNETQKKNRWFPIVFGNKLINFSTLLFAEFIESRNNFASKGCIKSGSKIVGKDRFLSLDPEEFETSGLSKAKKILSDIFQESQVIGYVWKDIRVNLYQCIPRLEWLVPNETMITNLPRIDESRSLACFLRTLDKQQVLIVTVSLLLTLLHNL